MNIKLLNKLEQIYQCTFVGVDPMSLYWTQQYRNCSITDRVVALWGCFDETIG